MFAPVFMEQNDAITCFRIPNVKTSILGARKNEHATGSDAGLHELMRIDASVEVGDNHATIYDIK